MIRCGRTRCGLATASLCLLLALLACFGSLTAFGAPGGGDSSAAPVQTAALPTPEAGCRNLVITAFYTPGNVAGAGVCNYAFAELYNGGDRAVSLAGLSLYLPDGAGGMTEYPLPTDAGVPAGGCFLIRGAAARAVESPVLRLTEWDAVLDFCPDPTGVRVVLAASGTGLRTEEPLAGQDGVYAYLSAAGADAGDAFHYVRKTGAGRLLRKRADTDKVEYQSLKLDEASWTVLRQITPRTTSGRVNGEIAGQLAEVAFSAPGGVYEQGFDLTMTAPEGYTVYYSVNGDDPRRAWELGRTPTRYTGALHLRDTTDMTWGQLTKLCATRMGGSYYPVVSSFPGAAVVRAYAVRDSDGAVTPMTTQTYFIGAAYRDWDMDIVSVSVSAEDFLGDDGIYLCRTSVHEHIPAYVEFMSRDGESVFSGWSEIAMNGRGSLGMRQKSFRILLKSDPLGSEGAGENLNTLNYDLFGEYANCAPDGERVTWYRHILLRNGGGDNSGCTISRSHIGDAYIQRIDRYLKPDDMAYAPVMTFVNGEFWGLFNARDRLDTKYFTGRYGIAEEDFSMLECPYPLTYGWNVDYMAAYGDPAQADEFNALVRFIKTHSMADLSNYLYVSGKLDIDGLIDFFCAQIYLCCSDWPGNNIKVWRNTNPDGGMDTKWHFCIVDTDHGVGLNSSLDTNLFGVINDGSILGAVVNHLMQNSSFRERFVLRFVWCTEVYFQPERLVSELDELVARIKPVMQLQLDRWRVTDGSVTTYGTWWSYIEVIRNFVTNRPAYARRQLMSWAGLDDAAYRSYAERAVRMWGDGSGVCVTQYTKRKKKERKLLLTQKPRSGKMDRKTLYDRIYACWLGKNIGGTLGTPVEGCKEVMHIDWYPRLDPRGALPNDDLDLQLVNLHAMEQEGVRLGAEGIAAEWTEHVYFPWDEYGYSGTAMRMGFRPPFSGMFDNTFTDCMGSPIRSEIWAAICAGKPRLAAYFAWQDAVVDHAGGEGVFGEIFNAALEAAAYVSDDIPALIREALTYIPDSSRVYKSVSHILALYGDGVPLAEARESILREHGRDNFTDAPQNIAFELAGLLWGQDFEDAILKVVNLGYDTDCTVATCGAVLGILHGTAGIPEKWSAPIGDAIQVSAAIRGFTAPADLDELTQRCLSLYDKLALEDGERYTVTAEDNADFAVQHYVLPAHSRRDGGVTIDLRYGTKWDARYGDPSVAPEETVAVCLTVRNNTAWRWDTELSLRVPDGLYAADQPVRFVLEPGAETEAVLHVGAVPGVPVPDTRCYPMGLIVRRFNCGDVWTDYRLPFTLLAPNRWRLNGREVLCPGTQVRFPEASADGVYVAEATLTAPYDRPTRLLCNTVHPVTVTLDGRTVIRSDTAQGFLPAYHRVPADNRYDGLLTGGTHTVLVEIHTAPGDQPPLFVISLNATAEVAEPGNFYAYTDDHFAAAGN